MPDPTPSPSAPDANNDTGTAFGWRAHEAIQAWTASVDSKASVALIVEVAVTAAATKELISRGGALHRAIGLHLATATTACVLLVLAVAGALAVIAPRLARRRNARLGSKGLIYFRHLKDQTADQITERLAGMTPERERRELAAQLQITAEKAWNKHVALQASLALFATGSLLLAVAFVAF